MNHSKPKLDFNTLAESLKSGIESYCDDAAERHIGIEEFVTNYLDLGVTPTQAQITLLKAFYNEPLTVEQQSILECWRAEGRTNWQEGQGYQNLILEAGRRSGKCLIQDSWVLTNRGWETLAEIGEEWQPQPDTSTSITRQVSLPDGTWTASHLYYLGESETVRLELEHGLTLEGTPEHKVWCAPGTWKTLGELQPTDKVAVWLGGNWEGTPMDLQEAYLLGVACASRFSHLTKELRIDCHSRDTTYYQRQFQKLGYKAAYQQGSSRQRRHLVFDETARARFIALDYPVVPPEQIAVPKPIRLGTKSVQQAFLQGLLENSEGSGYCLWSQSLTLVTQVQRLLLPFGVLTKIIEKKTRRRHVYYALELTDWESLKHAAAAFPLQNPAKKNQVDATPEKPNPNQIVWLGVVKLSPGRGICMDLHVPGKEAYIAQGILSHNTSMCASIIGAYEFFKLARMVCPQEHYGIAKISTISILCLATQATQGQRTIFGGIKAVIQECKYFQRLIEAQELFLLDEEIRYPRKRLAIYAGTSKSSSQVGATLKALIMDEVARFENEKGISNALELWSNLGASTVTFGQEAIKVAISSAWCQGDAIQILLEKSKYAPRSLTFSLRSWDLNPVKAARDNPIIVAAYAEDPIKAALEFENIRPAVGDSFIPLSEIEAIPKRNAAVTLEPATVTIGGTPYKTVRVKGGTPAFANTVLHIDPSMGKDGYGLAFGHSEFNEEGLMTVVIDGLALWQKDAHANIYLADVEKVILDIHQLRPIVKITADHYGSGAETLQRLRLHGLVCETVYFSNRTQVEMYELLRQLIHQHRLVIPGDSFWTGLLVRELSRVQLVRGVKIDHPPGVNESKDLADAVAAVAWQLSQRIFIDRSVAQQTPTTFTTTTSSPVPIGLQEKQLRRQKYAQFRSLSYAKRPA